MIAVDPLWGKYHPVRDLACSRVQAERDRYLLALDDIYNDRGDPKEIAKVALRGK